MMRFLLLAQEAESTTSQVAEGTGGDAASGDPIFQMSEFKDQALEYLETHGPQLLINIVTAIVIYYVGKIVAAILTRMMSRVLARTKMDEMLVRFLTNIVYYLLLAIVAMAALEQLGVETTSFAAVLAAAGFAIGMALQGSLGNFAAGVMLVVFRPFKMGDFVEAGGVMGTVEEIALFSTILKTPDNRRVIVPNGEITNGVITNNSHNPTRRIDLVIGCAYGDDLLAVKSFLNDVIDEDPRILDDPEPQVAVSELGESSVNFIVRPWVKTSDYADVKYALTERIKLGFDQRGFNFPFPSRDVYTHTAD
ncbi:MAG: mechanosensitive ion channel [Planctomycetaceae bacterium]|nr:mechanosensitive ion channel [Planctomycetaceae bacterium]